jgi:hypothetical protein
MHRKKEEVILRILAQESLDLELWLKRYEFLMFLSYFVDFSEARDLFGIIFQIPGSDCKFLDCGLILEKPRGLSAKCPKLNFSGIVFLKETRGPSARVRGPRRPGPPWTGGHCHAQELTGARPPAAPVPESSDRGAGERKGGLANSMAGRWKGISPATEASAQKGDDEGTVRAKRGSVGGVGGFIEGGVSFYRAEARRGRAERLQLPA